MSDFDKINILGTVVNVKDSTARDSIEETNNNLNTLSDKVANYTTKVIFLLVIVTHKATHPMEILATLLLNKLLAI